MSGQRITGCWQLRAKRLSNCGGPAVDLGEIINYGFLGSMRRFLARPILWSD
jgi:hypothetical protein